MGIHSQSGGGLVDGKSLRENSKGKGHSGGTVLTECLLKAGQDGQTSCGEWWRVRNPIKYGRVSDIESGDFWLNQPSSILTKIE